MIKTRNLTLALAGVVLALGLDTGKLAAQPGPGWPGIDPQQIQQRAKEFFRDKLVVTNDLEWSVIEARLTKVVQLKIQTEMGGVRMMDRMRPGGNGGGPSGIGAGLVLRALFGIEPLPEAEALQKAIDDHASKADLKLALSKYVEARRRKQAELEKAQADLCQVITLHQEGMLVLMGILD
jgi:hypothetical protein